MSRRMLLVYGVTLVQMILLGIVIWLINKTAAWWAYLLWFLPITTMSTWWRASLPR